MAYGRSYLKGSRGGLRIGSFLRKAVGTVARVAGTVFTGGVTGTVLGAVMPGGSSTGGARSFTGGGQRPEPGITGMVHRMAPGGHTGYLPSRRMNAGNAKAARRAIRRIKSVRKLLQSIERELPRRPAARSSAGVITRREAARALSS